MDRRPKAGTIALAPNCRKTVVCQFVEMGYQQV